jgi:purine-binding chemotaxis protein CheW
MTAAPSGLAERAAELRASFDRAFAVPIRSEAAATQDLLAIAVGTEPYAIRLSEVTGLFADRRITPIPGSSTALLGIAGFRGTIVPVYSLPMLLGHSPTQLPRWLVIAAVAPVALAFDQLDGHLRAAAEAILPRQSPEQARGYALEFVRTESVVRPVLHLPFVVDALGTMDRPQVMSNQE